MSKAFVQGVFDEKTKQIFSNLTKQITKPEDLYYSPAAEGQHIQGDMTSKLHLTIYYGLQLEAVDDDELKKLVNSKQISEINLGSFYFIPGFQNLYKVLCIEVLDQEGFLLEFCKEVSKFVTYDKYVERFKPHLTIVYVQSNYLLPTDLPELPKSINISEFKISENL